MRVDMQAQNRRAVINKSRYTVSQAAIIEKLIMQIEPDGATTFPEIERICNDFRARITPLLDAAESRLRE